MFCSHCCPNFFYQWLLTKHSLHHVHWQENSAIPSLQAPLDCNLGNSVFSKWLSKGLIPRSDENQIVLIRRHNLKGAEDNISTVRFIGEQFCSIIMGSQEELHNTESWLCFLWSYRGSAALETTSPASPSHSNFYYHLPLVICHNTLYSMKCEHAALLHNECSPRDMFLLLVTPMMPLGFLLGYLSYYPLPILVTDCNCNLMTPRTLSPYLPSALRSRWLHPAFTEKSPCRELTGIFNPTFSNLPQLYSQAKANGCSPAVLSLSDWYHREEVT